MANEEVEGGLPPKQTPFKPMAPLSSSAAAPRTVVLKRPSLRKPGEAPVVAVPPVAAAPVAQGIAVTHPDVVKRMTSRINLSTATAQIVPPPEAVDAPTIKLRAPGAPVVPAAISAANSAPPSPIKPSDPVQPAKSKTSRISLETAFSTQPDLPPVGSAPKTIRLKRPTDVSAPATAAPKVTLKPPTTHVTIPPPPSRTGHIPSSPAIEEPSSAAAEQPSAGTENGSPTRLKTIKVKRPHAGGPKVTINVAPSTGGTEDANLQNLSSIEGVHNQTGPDKMNPVFLVAVIIGIIITVNLMWVFAAQAFGPNAAVADYASMKGANVPNPPGASSVE